MSLPRLHPDDLAEIKSAIAEIVGKEMKLLSLEKSQKIQDNMVFSVKEAAKFLGLNPQTISKYCKDGHIKAIKKGKSWLITQEAINNYLKTSP